MILIHCTRHPRYTATRRPRNCNACDLLYVFRWQHDKDGERRIGGLNPFQFLDPSDDDLSLLRAEDER